jgi:hypothetical protein
MAFPRPAVRALGSRLTFAVVVAAFAFGAPACHYTPLLAPSGSAITFSAPDQAAADETVTVDVLVLESKSAAAPPTTSGTGNPNNTNNATPIAGGGTPVHDGTLVTFTTTIGEMSPAEAHTSHGHATVSFIGDGTIGTAKIVATSGTITASHDLKLNSPGGSGGQ